MSKGGRRLLAHERGEEKREVVSKIVFKSCLQTASGKRTKRKTELCISTELVYDPNNKKCALQVQLYY